MATAAQPEVDLTWPDLQPLAAADRRAQGSGKPAKDTEIPATSGGNERYERRRLTLTSEFCDASFTRGDCCETHRQTGVRVSRKYGERKESGSFSGSNTQVT